MRIGTDFDNTIVGYERLFSAAAREAGLVPPGFTGGKNAVRAAVRARKDGERDWQALQRIVYGERMVEAEMLPGFRAFAEIARASGAELHVVSHKTSDLREAATRWMAANGLFDLVPCANVFFEETRAAKIERIKAIGCTHFIDDLEEVFAEPGFPANVAQILFHDWRAALQAIHKPVGAGGNSAVLRAGALAVKLYADDGRDRLGQEVAALRFLEAHGGADVPRVRVADRDARIAAFDWIDGAPADEAQAADTDALLAFLARTHALRTAKGAEALPGASAHCYSAAAAVRQLEERFARLRPLARDYLERELRPAAEAAVRAAREGYAAAGLDFDAQLPETQRTLSPSDFGFHNAIRRSDNSLAFVDFEYFGWDDPAKLVSDVLWHPGHALTAPLRERFREGAVRLYGGDPAFDARLAALHPLFGIIWCLIVLNPLTADPEAGVLQKSRALLRRANKSLTHDVFAG